MTATAEPVVVTDDMVRDWARSTGRKTGERGRVSDALKAEYMAGVAELHGGQAPAADAPGGSEKPPERPKAAAQERRPKPVSSPGSGGMGRLRAWLGGAPETGKRKTSSRKAAGPARPRTPLVSLVDRGWSRVAAVIEHVNVPVARTMAWQAPYVGVVADDVIAGTPPDKVLQVVARAEETLSGLGAMVAMPIVVGMITSERNNPETHGMPAVARQQALAAVLEECVSAQLDMFGSRNLAEKLAKAAVDHAVRKSDVKAIIDMIFAPAPPIVVIPENATPEQAERIRARAEAEAAKEAELREAVAAVKYMPAPPAEPDTRGQAAEVAAASMAASAHRAELLQEQAIQQAHGLGSGR